MDVSHEQVSEPALSVSTACEKVVDFPLIQFSSIWRKMQTLQKLALQCYFGVWIWGIFFEVCLGILNMLCGLFGICNSSFVVCTNASCVDLNCLQNLSHDFDERAVHLVNLGENNKHTGSKSQSNESLVKTAKVRASCDKQTNRYHSSIKMFWMTI